MNKKDKLRKLDEQRVLSMHSVLWMRPYKNCTVEHILNIDPGFLNWLIDKNIVLFDDDTYIKIQTAVEQFNDNINYRED